MDDDEKEGVDEAFKRLYKEHSKKIMDFFRQSKRMSVSDAGDLLQLTFMELLKALQKNPDLSGELRKPRVFLYTLAHRQFVAWLRHKARRPQIDDGPDGEVLDSQAASDDEELLHALRSDQRLRLRALRKLQGKAPGAEANGAAISDPQMVLYLRFWAGLTLAEVSRVLDRPMGTVSGQQNRGLALLKQRLDELGSRDEADHRTSTQTLLRWEEEVQREALERGQSGADEDA